MPGTAVVSECPAETRDSPTLSARAIEKLVTETEITQARDFDLLRLAGDFVFARHEVTGDVPAIRTAGLWRLCRREHSSVNKISQTIGMKRRDDTCTN